MDVSSPQGGSRFTQVIQDATLTKHLYQNQIQHLSHRFHTALSDGPNKESQINSTKGDYNSIIGIR